MSVKAAVDYGIRKATIEDVEYLSTRLRAMDLREISSVSERSARSALLSGLRTSDFCRVGTVDGYPVCIYGVRAFSSLSREGMIWMLGTDDLASHFMRFGRECMRQVKEMVKNFDYVENWCHADNKLTIRWLKWLGFGFDYAEPYGRDKELYHRFFIDNVSTKMAGWEGRLVKFLQSRAGVPFKWGTNDCCIFVADAIEQMNAVDVGYWFRGKFTKRNEAFKLMQEYSGGSTAETWDRIARDNNFREINQESLQFGDIVTMKIKAADEMAGILSNGISVGVHVYNRAIISPGKRVAVISENPDIIKAWRI
jgi:hypothetical protein